MTRPSIMGLLPIMLTLSVASVNGVKEGKATARQGGCSLCPDGEAVGFPNRQIPTTNKKCKDSLFLDVLPDTEICEDFRKSAAWCGCPSVPQECFLCEGEESSPTPDLDSPLYPDVSCLDYEYIASELTVNECPSLSERSGFFDISAYCSCENTEAPTVCELCPGGDIANPQDPSVVAGMTCEQADQELLQFFIDKSLCIEFRQLLLFGNTCVCVGSTDYPTQAPTENSPTLPAAPITPSPTITPSTPSPTTTPSTPSPTTIPSTPSPTITPSTPSPTTTPSTPSQKGATSAPTSPTVQSTPSPTRTPTKGTKGATSSPTGAPTKKSFKGSTQTKSPSMAPSPLPETAPTAKSIKKQSKKEAIETTKKLKTKKDSR